MSVSEAGELVDVDFDNDTLNPGDTINVFDFLNNDWKNAVVQEIDISEREILVNYEDDSQEWISVDTRKIRFPPSEELKTPAPSRRRTSTLKVIENFESKTSATIKEPSVPPVAKESLDKPKKISKNDPSRKSSSSSKLKKAKSNDDRRAMSSRTTPSFWRLKFKSNNQLDAAQRKREKREQSRKSKSVNRAEGNGQDGVTASKVAAVPKLVPKTVQVVASKETIVSKPVQAVSAKVAVPLKLAQVATPKVPVVPKLVVKRKSSVDGAKKKRRDSDRKENEKSEGFMDTLKRKTPSRKNSLSSGESIDKTESSLKSAPVIPPAGKKIKTLLPKRASEMFPEAPASPAVSTPPALDIVTPIQAMLPPTLPNANISPSPTTPAASGFICPKQDCKKQFRNENLLMMHLKHYHPEYRNMLRSMPNVADLAYARTVGETIDSPQTGFLEKIVKLEEDKLKEKVDEFILPADDTCSEKKVEENTIIAPEMVEKPSDGAAKGSKVAKKLAVSQKRLSDSAPSSPKMPALLAQLQEPPLIPPSIAIHSADNSQSDLSILHSAPAITPSPQCVSNLKSGPDKSPVLSDLEDKHIDGKKSPARKRRLSHLDSTDVVNCTCGYGFEDGLMIRCDLCLCWQHGACNLVENEEQVPSTYICEPCLYPRRLHSSKKYCYVQNWVKDGIMPAYEFCEPPEEIMKKRETQAKQYHEYLCHLTDLRNAIRCLQVKLQILKQTPDHPKLYLWAKSWDGKKSVENEEQLLANDGPVPEAAINTADCRKNLSEHIAEEMKKVDRTLIKLEEEIDKLDQNEDDDDEDSFGKNPEKDSCIAKQTLLMMLRDLSSIQNLKYC